MTRLPDLLTALSHGPEATRPRLTHYDADGRIELSGKVLLNWVAKAANLLTQEYDARPGTVVGLDLPPGHWRAAYWALATWWCGAGLHVVGDADEAKDDAGLDVLITSRPGSAADAAPDVVAVTPAALARRSPTPLPAGVADEAAVLASYGDVFEPMESPEPGDIALTGDAAHDVTFADLAPGQVGSGRPRVLLAAPASQHLFLRTALRAWTADGSLVVTTETDAAALDRIATQESATQPA